MIQKPEYTDLNRFLVSIGLIMIAFSILVQWLFLRENFDLTISYADFSKLNKPSKEILSLKQQHLIKIIKFSPFISLGFALLGVIAIVVGVIRWNEKQVLLDERDDLTNKKMKSELGELSETEIEKKAEREYEDQLLSVDTEGNTEIEPTIDRNKVDHYKKRYIDIEKEIAEVLENDFGGTNKIVTNAYLKNSDREIDIVLQPEVISKDTNRYHVLFEVKFISEIKLNKLLLKSTTEQLNFTANAYKSNVNSRNVAAVIVTVSPEENYMRYKDYFDKLKERLRISNHIEWINIPEQNIRLISERVNEFLQKIN